MADSDTADLMVLLLGLLAFPTIWLGTLWVAARVSGWVELAKFYELKEPFRGDRCRCGTMYMYNGKLRSKYNGVMILRANEQGLYLRPTLLLRFGYPALFIPWTDITKKEDDDFFFPAARLRIRQAPSISMKLHTRRIARLEEIKNSVIPEGR